MKKLSKKSIIRIILIAAAAAAAVALILMFISRKDFYETHFFHGTYINGWDVSDMTAEDVKADIQSQIESYELTLEHKDGASEVITGVQLGFEYTDDNAIDELLEAQDGSEWFAHLSSTEDYTIDVSYTYSLSALNEVVDSLECMDPANVTVSENAYVELQGDAFVVVPEVVGTQLDKEALCDVVSEAVEQESSSINLEEQGLYLLPEITADNQTLIDRMNAGNAMLSAQITYDFVDSQWVVDRDEIAQWIVQAEDGTYTVNYDSVYQWVYNMAYETDTFGLPRNFMTSYGVEVQLEGGGDYGWCIDKDLTAQHLYENILAGNVAVMDPDYIFAAMDRSSNDIGGTYVEICISTQTLWLYYEGQRIVETPVITGNVSKGYSTPSGSVWAIDGMKTDWTFTTFANSYCDYWMPFNGDVGIHDALWQADSDYVVDTYLTAGSHGCVNTPYDAVRTVYEHVVIGTPVVVYYSLDQVHGPDPTEELAGGA